MVLAHSIVGNSFLKLFDKSCHISEIPPFIHKLSCPALFQQFLRSLLDLSQCAAKIVGKDRQGKQLISVPDQLCLSPDLPRVLVNRCRGSVVFEPVQLGLEIFDLVLDTFESLRQTRSVVRDSHLPDQYLMTLDKRAHPGEGCPEGIAKICRLFSGIEGYLDKISNSLPLCWEPHSAINELTNKR